MTWRETINVSAPWRDDSLDIFQKATAICEIFKSSKWYSTINEVAESGGVDQAIEEFGEDQIHAWVEEMEFLIEDKELTISLFNYRWDRMYDYADRDRVWVNVW